MPHVRWIKIMAMQLENQAALLDSPARCRQDTEKPVADEFIPPVPSRPSCTLSQSVTELLSPPPDDVMNHWPHTAMKLF